MYEKTLGYMYSRNYTMRRLLGLVQENIMETPGIIYENNVKTSG
jgi:hypothetical protein